MACQCGTRLVYPLVTDKISSLDQFKLVSKSMNPNPKLALTAFTLLLFSSAASAMTSRSSKTTKASSAPSFGVAARHVQPHIEEKEKRATAGDEKKSRDPGLWPSSCRSKCGWCSPCESIYVSVQPDMIIWLAQKHGVASVEQVFYALITHHSHNHHHHNHILTLLPKQNMKRHYWHSS